MNIMGKLMDAKFIQKQTFSLDSQAIEEVKTRAFETSTQRFRLCLHKNIKQQTHEMLIGFTQNSYMPPHRHPKEKSESYLVLEGNMDVYIFDDNGLPIKRYSLSPQTTGNDFLFRLNGNVWHMPVCTSTVVVYLETYSGPFKKNVDVEFPSWAPLEKNKKSLEFIKKVAKIARGNNL